jgi:hypothetical protein
MPKNRAIEKHLRTARIVSMVPAPNSTSGIGPPEPGEVVGVCPNCEQWQRRSNGGDCLNRCIARGFAPRKGA